MAVKREFQGGCERHDIWSILYIIGTGNLAVLYGSLQHRRQMKRRNKYTIAPAAIVPSIVVHNGVTHSGVARAFCIFVALGESPVLETRGLMVLVMGRLTVSTDVMVPTFVVVLVTIWLEVALVLA